MVQPRSREGDGPVGLRVERVDLVPTDLGTVIVRVAGRWEGDPVPAVPVLHAADRRFDALPESSSAAARAAPGAGAFRAAFSVPEELRPSLLGALRLTVGETEVALPAANEIEGDPSGAPGIVVDRAVLAERRARRAELAEEEVARRAEEAEGSVAALEAELAKLELRLERAGSERAELEARLADTARDARTAAQRAHAERRRREEAVEEAADRVEEAEHGAERLRARLAAAEERSHALAREIEALRRRVSEAEHAATTSEAARRRAEHDAAAARPWLGPSRQGTLRAEHALATRAQRPALARPAPVVPLAGPGAASAGSPARGPADLTGLLAAERRAVAARRAASGPANLRDESRRAASAVAEAAWTLAEARDAMGSVAGGVQAAQAALARAEHDRDALLAERERLLAARSAAEAQARRLRDELSLQAESQARAERAIGELGARIEELQAAAAAARRGVEAEAAVRELSAAAGEALAEAERRIGEAQQAATEAQDRLDAERADREAAEHLMHAAFERQIQDLQRQIEEAATAEPVTAAKPTPAGPAAASEPSSLEQAAPPAPLPPAGRTDPAPRPRSAWLSVALERLAGTSPGEAARLGVQLLPGQALAAAEPLDYDLRVAGIGWHAVTLREARGTVAPLESHRSRRAADFRLELDAAALARLLTAGGSPALGRAGHVKVRGTLRRRRAVRAVPAAELDLARLAEAHVWPDPGLVLRALAGLIAPEWTRGHAFAVALVVLGPRGGRWRVRAADGAPLDVGSARTAEDAGATVRMTQAAYQRLLAGRPESDDRRTRISGDAHAVAALVGWIERAQHEAA
jgi:hypothetical protein